jgi:hypothetical protein
MSLTLRGFVDAGAALLVDEYRRLGIDLSSALEKVALIGGKPGGSEDAVPQAAPDRVDNQAAMNMRRARMSGVQGSPVR